MHQKQIDQYVAALKRMGYTQVEGHLLYITFKIVLRDITEPFRQALRMGSVLMVCTPLPKRAECLGKRWGSANVALSMTVAWLKTTTSAGIPRKKASVFKSEAGGRQGCDF